MTTAGFVQPAQAAQPNDAALPAVGQYFEFSLSDLPPPYAPTPDKADPSNQPIEEIVRPRDAMPSVPPGFHVAVFADGLRRPREIATAPGGLVFVSETHQGDILALRDADGDGTAETSIVFAEGFREPTGLAVENGALYVVDRRAVWRIGFDPSTLEVQTRVMVTRPGALGEGGGHVTREIVFAPDGKHFLVAIGSQTNVGEDPSPRATIQQFSLDGQMQTSLAAGLRNPVGMAFNPDTDDLYAVVNEREGLGPGLVPDYLTRVKPGAFYGFPYAYLGAHPDPQFGDLRPDLVQATETPDLLFPPRSMPLGLLFCHGDAFPPDYRGDALVALHGAWRGGAPVHGIARVRFHEGRPGRGYEIFMSGFEMGAGGVPGVWGRPVWLAQTDDGALLVSDDVANVIWRVTWTGTTAGAEEAARIAGTRLAAPEGPFGGPSMGFVEPSEARFPGMVEPSGIEPLTSSLRTRRSPN